MASNFLFHLLLASTSYIIFDKSMIFLCIDYIEPVPVLSCCQRMLVVDVRTRSLYPPQNYLSIGSGLILVTLFTMDITGPTLSHQTGIYNSFGSRWSFIL